MTEICVALLSGRSAERETAQLAIEMLMMDGAAGPPSSFVVFRLGKITTEHGDFVFSEDSAKKVMEAAKKYGNDYAIDYGHAMHKATQSADPAQAGKAAGWFTLAFEQGELVARVKKWTPAAQQMLTDGEYRYFSPVFSFSKDTGEILELLSIALTNIPATYSMTPLMASQAGEASTPKEEPQKMDRKLLIAMLGLADNATDAEIAAALQRSQNAVSELATLTSQKEVGGVMGTVKAWKAQSEQVAELTKQLAEHKSHAEENERVMLLEQGKRDKKVTPALEPMLKKMPMEEMKAFLSALPAFVPAPSQEPTGTKVGTMLLTNEEKEVAEKMGVSLEALAKSKKGGKHIEDPTAKKQDAA